MLKSHSLKLNQKDYQLHIQQESLDAIENSDFYTHYPHIYFKPKDHDLELFASGAIFHFHDYPRIEADFDLPIFIIGEDKDTSCDFLKRHAFIPKSWIVKTAGAYQKFTITSQEAIDFHFQVMSEFESTKEEFALNQISNIIETIKSGQIDKCVFAQIQKYENTTFTSIDQLQNALLNGTKFFFRLSSDFQFFGATPEWIYKKNGSQIAVEAIAGTTSGDTIEELDDPKIVQEFNLVKTGILEDIALSLENGSFCKKDSVIYHNNLAHRYNVLEGVLKDSVNDHDLIQMLHPTAAISGRPKSEALKLINELEGFKRGFYSSPVGFYTPSYSFIAVAIRSALQTQNSTILFSGAGIVKDSQPKSEWDELMKKITAAKKLISKS